jgi:hypothetical protein
MGALFTYFAVFDIVNILLAIQVIENALSIKEVQVDWRDVPLRSFKRLNAWWVVCFTANFILWIVYWSIWFADSASFAL